jgi:ribosomal protein L44E
MKCNAEIIMANRVCSYCGSHTYYENDKQSNGQWYSLLTQDSSNKRCLYFLCSNCYLKQTNKNTQRIHAIINVKWQNRKELDIKQKISKLKASFMQKIIMKSIE